jgi:hypothetical protein
VGIVSAGDLGQGALAERSVRGLLPALVTAWAATVLSARITTGPVGLIDLAVSLGYVALFATLYAIAGRVEPARRARYRAFTAWFPVALNGAWVAASMASVWGALPAWVIAGVFALGVARVARFERDHGEPIPRPGVVVAVLGAAAACQWALVWIAARAWHGADASFVFVHGAMPPLAIALSIAAAWTVLALGARRWPALAAGAVLIAAIAPNRGPAVVWQVSAPSAAPDIVMITVDTLRADYGERMASFQRIAASGTALEATSTSTWTLPAMASITTGLWPSEHGAGRRPDGSYAGIRADLPTVALRLSEVGYDTAKVCAANPFLGNRFGFDRGFAAFVHRADDAAWRMPGSVVSPSARPALVDVLTVAGLVPRPAYGAAHGIVDDALAVAAQQRDDHPMYLRVHFLDLHSPYADALTAPIGIESRRRLATGSLAQSIPLADSVAAYAHEARIVDREIGRLLDGLGPPRARGRIVVLTADHGESLGERGEWGHGGEAWAEVTTVPLAIAGIDVLPSVGEEGPISLVDIPMTLLSAAGAAHVGLSGIDLATRRPPATRVLPVEMPLSGGLDPFLGAAIGRWRVVMTADGPRAYDRVSDPAETVDVAALHPEVVAAALAQQDRVDAPQRAMLTFGDRLTLEMLGYISD